MRARAREGLRASSDRWSRLEREREKRVVIRLLARSAARAATAASSSRIAPRVPNVSDGLPTADQRATTRARAVARLTIVARHVAPAAIAMAQADALIVAGDVAESLDLLEVSDDTG